MSDRQSFEHFLRHVVRVEQHVTLTAAQWVLVRVCFDDDDPADLSESDQAIALELFGDVRRFPPEGRHVLALLKGARIGGSWLSSLFVLYLGLTCPLGGLASGEIAFGVIVCPDMRLAAQAFRYVAGAIDATPSIGRLVVARSTDSITLRRPDGHTITIECLPASRGGAATRGRTLFAALLDEASFFRDADSGQVNDLEVYRSVTVRVLPGGRVLVVSTAWLESGVLQELIQTNHGHPTTAVACIARTLTMRNDTRIRTIVEEERLRDRDNAAREFDCQPLGSGASTYFDGAAINASLREGPINVAPVPGAPVGASADFAFVHDSSALAIVQLVAGFYQLSELLELRPGKDAPLQPSAVVAEFAIVCQRYGVRRAAADGHYREAIREHLTASSLDLRALPEGQSGKIEMYSQTRALLHEGVCRISRDAKKLISQLREVVAKPTPGGGLSITSPRKQSGHGDLVSAYVGAIWSAAQHGARDAKASKHYSQMRARTIRLRQFFRPRDLRSDESVWHDLPPHQRGGRY
jgi:hypothetical protein